MLNDVYEDFCISRFSRKQNVLNFTGDKDEREELKDSIRKLVKSQVDQLIFVCLFREKYMFATT